MSPAWTPKTAKQDVPRECAIAIACHLFLTSFGPSSRKHSFRIPILSISTRGTRKQPLPCSATQAEHVRHALIECDNMSTEQLQGPTTAKGP